MSAGGAAAAVAIRSERRIAALLRDAGALSPDRAIPVHPQRMMVRGALRRLVRAGAVRQAGTDSYWLDGDRYADFRDRRRKRIWLVLGIALIIAAIATWSTNVRAQTVAPTSVPRPDLIAFRALYEELVETNTTLSEGSCTLAAQRMAARLTAAGFAPEDVEVVVPDDQPTFGSLVAVLHGTSRSTPAMLLMAHIDVVEARRADWTRDPFTLVEEDGYFYARGASDDKAEAAVWVDTLIRLKQQGFRPRRDIKLALTCGEETSDTWNGVSWLLEHRPETLAAGFALNEGAGGQLDEQGRHLALNIQAGEKVYQDYTLTLTNPGGHSSRPRKDNAIAAMGAALARLNAHDFALELNPVTRAYFAALAGQSSEHAADLRALTATDTPDAAAAARLAAANPSWNGMMRTTCIPTLISGGHAPNAQPQTVTANVNCRILPGHSLAETQAEIARVLDNPAITLEAVGEPSPTAPAPPLTPAMLGPVTAVAARVWPGVPVIPTMTTGATDGRFTNAAGIPTYGLTGMFTDPDGGGVHGLNERIRVNSLYDGREFLFDVVKAYAMQR